MSSAARTADVVVVGAGIVGLSTAMQLLERRPDLSIVVLDKEGEIGRHQTGHNSGVIHRGIYYAPGSLKAKLCVAGARRLTEFCDANEIPYRLIGKLIIAADDSELHGLQELHRRGQANGVEGLRWVDGDSIASVEPHAAGVAALHSPATGIVDFSVVARAFADQVQSRGGTFSLSTPVTAIRQHHDHVEVRSGSTSFRASVMVSCAGLHSDRLAAMTGQSKQRRLRIVPFRGDYHLLRFDRANLVRGLIYPVPDSRFPFLGVHFTPRMDGSVWLGPNAVLAFAREGYRLGHVSVRDLVGTLWYAGFLRLALKYWKTGAQEMWRDVSRPAFARALRRYVPELRNSDLVGHASGVRAQAVASDGSLVDDFEISAGERVIHVLNAPSPAATSSLAIGEHIGERVLEQLAAASA